MARISPNMNRIIIRGSRCIYCGAPATTDEHFPPYTSGRSGLLLSACSECNTYAGTKHPHDFAARAKYVQTRLKRKYGKRANSRAWETTEPNTEAGLVNRGWALQECEWRRTMRARLTWRAIPYLAFLCTAQGVDVKAILERH